MKNLLTEFKKSSIILSSRYKSVYWFIVYKNIYIIIAQYISYIIGEKMRINKFLASCGVASRRKSEEFIINGHVKVNGQVVTKLDYDINEKKDKVEVDGKLLRYTEKFEYYLLNKPKGYVCTSKDEHDRKIVIDLIKTNARIFSVGRLDYNSEGLLLLTNDGDLNYKLTHPSYEIRKTYIVKIKGSISESEKAVIRNGIVVKGVRYAKCKLTELEKTKEYTRLEIVIHEGKNHEIRNMFEFINKEIIMLKRTKIGDLKLGGLNRGEYRSLKDYEVEYLKNL